MVGYCEQYLAKCGNVQKMQGFARLRCCMVTVGSERTSDGSSSGIGDEVGDGMESEGSFGPEYRSLFEKSMIP